MYPTICPTVTASDLENYRQQIERITEFAVRIHIDLSDGTLAPSKLLDVSNIWWPGGIRADLHAMVRRPLEQLEVFKALSPQLVIVHAEAEGNFALFAQSMHQSGIETGVALLQDTPVEAVASALDMIDHVLVFSGHLGYVGGQADLQLLDKVRRLKQLKPALEIGWDGGINEHNARALKDGGVEVLNVGGFIQRSPQPAKDYELLHSL